MLMLVITSVCLSIAQQITFEASAKSNVSVGERFQVSFVLNRKGTDFKSPSFNGFQVLSNPSPFYNEIIINGNKSATLTYSIVLQADKEGTFTIPPAKIKVNGTEIESNEIKITVTKAAATNNQQSQKQQSSAQGNKSSPVQDDKIFVKVSLNKTKAYRGEAIIITHKVYSKLDLITFGDEKSSYEGFWSENVDKAQQITLNRETYNGQNYITGVLRQSIIYPEKAGKIEIEPFEIKVVVAEPVKMGWITTYQEVVKSLKTNSVSVEVLPFPLSGQPSDFSGLTGDFSMKAEISKLQAEANEAVNLKITISGTGNMKQVNAPALEFPPDIESYDPKTVDNIKIAATTVSGSRTFDYLLIPRHAGEFKIGPFSFSYFDAAKGKYIELKQPEFTLVVGKGNGEEDKATGVTIASKEDLKVLGSDIRYIKTNEATVTEKGKYFFRSPLFFTLSGAPLLLYLGFFLWHRNMVKQSGNVALMKSRRANKIAGKRLALAKKFLQEKKRNEYYEEIFKALWGYISDKLSIPVAELTKEKIKETMLAKNVNEATINEFIALLDKAEFARFAPAGGEREMDTVYTESVDVISKIEGNV